MNSIIKSIWLSVLPSTTLLIYTGYSTVILIVVQILEYYQVISTTASTAIHVMWWVVTFAVGINWSILLKRYETLCR